MSSIAPPNILPSLRDDAAVIAVVGFAHGSSHFFHLMLPPLFPWLIKDFGLGFITNDRFLAVMTACASVASSLCRSFWGGLSDRFGYRVSENFS